MASLRFDAWWLRDGRATTTPVATGITTTTEHPDREETRASPRLGLVFRARPGLSLTASGYGDLYATEWHCPGLKLNYNA